jgi:hypothetical protein
VLADHLPEVGAHPRRDGFGCSLGGIQDEHYEHLVTRPHEVEAIEAGDLPDFLI